MHGLSVIAAAAWLTQAGCAGHSGMGGFHAFADLRRNLAVCVVSNVYEPLLAHGGSETRDIAVICRLARRAIAAAGSGRAGGDR